MSDWQNVALGEILDVHNGFAFKSKDFLEQGVPVIKIKNVKPNTILLDTLSYVSEELASQKSRYLIKPDDILITMSGNRFDGSPETWVGKVALFKIKGTYLLNQRVSCLRVDRKLALPEFIAYLLSSWHYQVYFINHANSSGGQANISPTIVQEVEIDLPSLEEQEGITAVLSSLDDKIDLLHRQNKTLEALAQTLFRHWFIDGAEDDWEERPLDEIAVYLNGLACQKYPPENESDRLPVLKIKELRNGISDQSDWATNTVSEEYIVENGDVIFSWSGSLMVKIWDGATCVLNQHLFKVTSEEFPKWFYYLWTIHHLEKFIAIAASKATTMGHIKRGDLSNSMVLIPTEQELDEMSRTFAPLLDKLILNNRQITKLTSLRDTLLPKLMSGEVRVRHQN